MSTSPLFSADEINGQASGGSSPTPMPSNGLFSTDEISAAQGNTDSANAGEQFKSQAWADAGHKLLSGDIGGAMDSIGSLFTDKNPAAVQAASQLKDAAIGAGKQITKGMANIGDIATLGTTHLLPGADKASGGIGATGTALNPTNDDQAKGALVGDAATFELGSGIMDSLAHLPLAERMIQAAKALKVAQEHPVIAAVASKAIQSGATAGAGTLVATGNPKAAAEAVPIGGTVGAVAEPISKVASDVADKITDTAGDVWGTLKGLRIQKNLQNSVRSIMNGVADDADVGEVKFPNVRDTVQSVSDAVQDKSKGLFQQIDDATDGEFTNLQNKIKNVDLKLRSIAGTDDTAEERLFNQKVALNTKLDEAIDAATQNGVDPDVADKARQAWKQSAALTDLDTQVKASTSGVAAGRGSLRPDEVVDPAKFAPRIQKMWDSGRLQEAVGDDAAGKLYDAVFTAAKNAGIRSTLTKAVAGAGGAGAALAGGHSVLSHLGKQ